MLAPALAFPALLGFWVFVGRRVRVEEGRVLDSPLAIFTRTMRLMTVALGRAYVPIVRHAAEQIEAWNETWRRIVAADPELQALLEAEFDLADDQHLAFDTTPLLPEGGTSE